MSFLLCMVGLVGALASWSHLAFREADEVLLAERWFSHVQRATALGAVLFVFASFATLSSAILAAPLLPLVIGAGLYPARRRVLEETWSFARYLVFQLRVTLAFGGTWFAIGVLPELVRLAPMPSHLAAVLGFTFAGGLMAAIGAYYPDLLGAKPLEDAGLQAAFARVLERTQIAKPQLLVVAPPGGRFANAVALPSTTKPRVLFGAALLEQLSPAEASAILGHEVAHLEHYDRKYLRRIAFVMYSLIAIGAALTPVLERFSEDASKAGALAWPLLVLVGWVAWMQSRQAHEGDCDVRAIELAGSGEDIISALTKVHRLARIPKRVSARDEAAHSHPTLQRRIARLRVAMGQLPEVHFETFIARDATDPTCFLVLTRSHVRMLHGVPPGTELAANALFEAATRTEAVTLNEIAALAVVARGKSRRLVATDTSGRELGVSLESDAVARAQAALDSLDATGAVGKAKTTGARPWSTLLIGVLLTFVTVPMDVPFAFAVLGFGTVFARGHRPTLHAVVGACACYCALIVLGGIDLAQTDDSAWAWIGGVGIFAATEAYRARIHRRSPPAATSWLVLTGLFAIPSAVALILFSTPAIELHLAAKQSPSLVIFCAAFAGALATGSPVRRGAAALFALLSAYATFSSTGAYARLVARDPLFLPAQELEITSAGEVASRVFAIDGRISDFQLSPSGRWALVRRIDPDSDYGYDEAPAGPWELFDLEAQPAPRAERVELAPKDDIVFIDEGRALLLESNEHQLSLSQLRLNDRKREGTIEIAEHTEELQGAALAIDQSAGRYWIQGYRENERGGARISGSIGAAPDMFIPHDVAMYEGSRYAPSAIAITNVYKGTPSDMRFASLLIPLRSLLLESPIAQRADVVAVSALGTRKLFATVMPPGCVPEDATGKVHWCIARFTVRTQLIRLDAESGAITARYSLAEPTTSIERVGNTLSIAGLDTVYLVDTRTSTARSFDIEAKDDCYFQTALLPKALAIVQTCEARSSIRLLSLTP